jgi:hypothetical protein
MTFETKKQINANRKKKVKPKMWQNQVDQLAF